MAASDAFVDLSNVCEYMVVNPWISNGGWRLEFLTMNLNTNKAELEEGWQFALGQIAGILLTGVPQFADAAADLKLRAENFKRVGS